MGEKVRAEGRPGDSNFLRGNPTGTKEPDTENELHLPQVWFEEIGFPLGNPFRARQPDNDAELEACFQDKPYFQDVAGRADQPTTTILSGKQGCGKSANRKMLERQCVKGLLGGLVLAVPYIDFSRFVEENSLSVTTRNHVDVILGKAVFALLDLLVDHPELLKQLYSAGDKGLLKYYVTHYSNLLDPGGMDSWLRSSGILNKAVNYRKMMDAVRNQVQVNWSGLTTRGGAVVQLLVDLLGKGPSMAPMRVDQLGQIPYLALLEAFVDLVVSLGVKAVYILIDHIDEVPELADDPARQAAVLEPLLASLPLMELRNTAFKFFIPTNVAEVLRHRRKIRPDRLRFRTITWSVADLVGLFERRLEVYSQGAFVDLSQFCAPGMEDIITDIATHAYASPRNMLRIGEWLIYEAMEQRPDGASYDMIITQAYYHRALARYEAEMQLDVRWPTDTVSTTPDTTTEVRPALFLDDAGNVWRFGVRLDVKLSDNEHKLLKRFCETPGKLLTRHELIEAVYGSTKTLSTVMAAFYATVGRLRKKVERDPRSPEFIITISSLGYRFEPQGKEPG